MTKQQIKWFYNSHRDVKRRKISELFTYLNHDLQQWIAVENIFVGFRVAVSSHQRVESLLGGLVRHFKSKPKQYQSFIYVNNFFTTQSAHRAFILNVLNYSTNTLSEFSHQVAGASYQVFYGFRWETRKWKLRVSHYLSFKKH